MAYSFHKTHSTEWLRNTQKMKREEIITINHIILISNNRNEYLQCRK